MERHVTREDLDELKVDIKALEHKVDELSTALYRIEVELAKTSAQSTLKVQADVARLELELANYRGRTGTEIGNISTKTAIVLSILGSTGLLLLGAWASSVMSKYVGRP